MGLNWREIDRWIFGEAWTGSRIGEHVEVLCEQIGPRWASSEGERQAVEYLREQFAQAGLADAALEEFALDTWEYKRAEATVGDMAIDLLPYNRCPPCDLEAPIVNAGYGTEHEIDRVRGQLKGSIAVMHLALEPFTTPSPPNVRLAALGDAGAVAVVAIDPKDGRRVEYHNGGDWREPETAELPIPAVTTSREHGALLQKWAGEGKRLKLSVESRFYQAAAHNVVASIPGARWLGERLMLGGHHDTVYGAPGGNDNASGTIAVLETARVLAGLKSALGSRAGDEPVLCDLQRRGADVPRVNRVRAATLRRQAEAGDQSRRAIDRADQGSGAGVWAFARLGAGPVQCDGRRAKVPRDVPTRRDFRPLSLFARGH